MSAVNEIDAYLAALPGATRTLGHGEWGITVAAEQAGGWPLELGLRLAGGLLTAKAHALSDASGIDPWMLLWWNRSTRHARFACTRAREVWVHADLPAGAVTARELDRVLGLVVEGAVAVREFQRVRASALSAPRSSDAAADQPAEGEQPEAG